MTTEAKLEGRHYGKAIKYNFERGFGFVKLQVAYKVAGTGLVIEDAFCHYSEIDKNANVVGHRKLEVGAVYEFDLILKDGKKLTASNIVLAESIGEEVTTPMEGEINGNR